MLEKMPTPRYSGIVQRDNAVVVNNPLVQPKQKEFLNEKGTNATEQSCAIVPRYRAAAVLITTCELVHQDACSASTADQASFHPHKSPSALEPVHPHQILYSQPRIRFPGVSSHCCYFRSRLTASA
jgi:hypothetical protein